jgi:hypothetical protein
MRRFLLLLVFFLSIPNQAQEECWPIVENFLGVFPYPKIPQADLDFEGVIFNYNGEGVRAIRTDIETSFFLILEDEHNFPAAGNFSLDGQWFAYPTGSLFENTTIAGDDIYHFTGLAVISSDPHQERFDYELPESEHSGAMFVNSMPYAMLAKILWLDNENMIYHLGETDSYTHLNTETGDIRVSVLTDENLRRSLEPSRTEIWFPDGSAYLATDSIPLDQSQTVYTNALYIFDTDSLSRELIAEEDIIEYALSPDARYIGFIRYDRIYIADLDTRTIEDLCLQVPSNSYNFYGQILHQLMVWSPDSQYLAFLYDGYPILLNLESREMQILQYRTWSLMGWYPLEERYD